MGVFVFVCGTRSGVLAMRRRNFVVFEFFNYKIILGYEFESVFLWFVDFFFEFVCFIKYFSKKSFD